MEFLPIIITGILAFFIGGMLIGGLVAVLIIWVSNERIATLEAQIAELRTENTEIRNRQIKFLNETLDLSMKASKEATNEQI